MLLMLLTPVILLQIVKHGIAPPLLGSSCRTHSNCLDCPRHVRAPRRRNHRRNANSAGSKAAQHIVLNGFAAGRSLSLSKLASIAAPAISSPRALYPPSPWPEGVGSLEVPPTANMLSSARVSPSPLIPTQTKYPLHHRGAVPQASLGRCSMLPSRPRKPPPSGVPPRQQPRAPPAPPRPPQQAQPRPQQQQPEASRLGAGGWTPLNARVITFELL